jgi:predicted anti-sigma-YlaC factor YlaD
MLSTFEAALLDRHLRRCAECSAFAQAVGAQTHLLRAAALEQPPRIELPVRTASPFRRGAVGALSAVVAAAAAALVLLSPTTDNQGGGQVGETAAMRTVGRSVLVVYPEKFSPASHVEMPRLRVQPASIADGPVHGYFSIPV